MTIWARDRNDTEGGQPHFAPSPHGAEWIPFDVHAASPLMDRADTFVEIGCADGRHLKLWTEEFPDKTFIGFDTPVLIEMARDHVRGAAFLDDWNLLLGVVRADQTVGRIVCLIRSSSLDEIFCHRDGKAPPEVDLCGLERLFDLLAYPIPEPGGTWRIGKALP